MELTNRKKCEITNFFKNIIDVPRGMDHGWPDIRSIVKFQTHSVCPSKLVPFLCSALTESLNQETQW